MTRENQFQRWPRKIRVRDVPCTQDPNSAVLAYRRLSLASRQNINVLSLLLSVYFASNFFAIFNFRSHQQMNFGVWKHDLNTRRSNICLQLRAKIGRSISLCEICCERQSENSCDATGTFLSLLFRLFVGCNMPKQHQPARKLVSERDRHTPWIPLSYIIQVVRYALHAGSSITASDLHHYTNSPLWWHDGQSAQNFTKPRLAETCEHAF